jgi:oxygen-independent coproporphyrinogen-3 oxidase
MVMNREVVCPSDEKTLSMYNFAYRYLKENGFTRYEVSNFAKKGYECKHNMNTWKMCEYIGFGAGAHSYHKGIRYNNINSIEEYINIIALGKKPIEQSEKISKQEKFEETIMLGLRTKDGIDVDQIKKVYKIDLLKDKKETINNLLSLGLISLVYNRIIVRDEGMAVLNRIILDLVS